MQTEEIIIDLINRTNSELILFCVLIVVAFVVAFIPLYAMILRDRRDRAADSNLRHDKYLEREREIIKVVSANSEVIAGLKTMLELTGSSMNSSFVRVNERIDRMCDDVKREFFEIRSARRKRDEFANVDFNGK